MSFLSVLAAPYLRWRHSKGYGVHSPYAFSIVESCIRPGPYGYYGYQAIERILMRQNLEKWHKKEAFLILRLAINIPARKLIVSQKDMLISAIAKAADIPLTILNKGGKQNLEGGFIVCKKGDMTEEKIIEMVGEGLSALVFNPSKNLVKKITTVVSRGMIMEGKRVLLVVPRNEMSLVSYKMKFLI